MKDEKKKRDDITEEIRMANAAALEASTAAVKAKEAAATAASKALQAEEQVEISSAKAEEAAVLATRAVLEEKMKKAQSATLNQDRMIAETKEYAATVTSQAEKALLASQEAQEAATKSQEAAAAAESAAAEVNTAIELRQQARKVSEIAAEAATTAQTKAEEAQTASQAADIAVDVAEAANQNAKAQSAKAEAENAADIAESATGSRDGDSKETSWKSAAGQPVFSFSKLILGGFAGVFFYGIMMVMYFILHPCVNEETCSAMLSDRRTLRLRELRDPKGKERFFYDVHVYRWMMRNVPVLNQQIDDIVSAFRFYAQKDGVTDFTLLAVGDLTVTAQKLEQALVQRTQDEVFTLKTEVLTEPNTRSFYEQMDRISNVFLVSEYDMTGVPMLRKAMVSLEECDVKQEGHIVLN